MTLKDDASVDEVCRVFSGTSCPKLIVVDHTTTSPAGTVARTRACAGGLPYLHVPVFMSPDIARNAQGLVMTSGPEAVFEQVREPLQQMTDRGLVSR